MFRQAKNIDMAFRQTKMLCVLVIAGCFVFCIFREWTSYRRDSIREQRLYILYNGKVLEAFASDRKDNVPVEARDHISHFHQLFFTLEPDDKVITANMAKACYLADASAKKEYDNLKESGYYNNVISANISQAIAIDSIELDIDHYPYRFRCRATETITRTSSVVTRLLVTSGYLRNVARSDNNPHGFLIERWTILDNKDINVQNR